MQHMRVECSVLLFSVLFMKGCSKTFESDDIADPGSPQTVDLACDYFSYIYLDEIEYYRCEEQADPVCSSRNLSTYALSARCSFSSECTASISLPVDAIGFTVYYDCLDYKSHLIGIIVGIVLACIVVLTVIIVIVIKCRKRRKKSIPSKQADKERAPQPSPRLPALPVSAPPARTPHTTDRPTSGNHDYLDLVNTPNTYNQLDHVTDKRQEYTELTMYEVIPDETGSYSEPYPK